MLSSLSVSNHLSEYGEIRLSCTVFIRRGIHDPGNQIFLHQLCALLNSGGGIISMHNDDVHKHVLPKHLDLWWSGMESNIASILATDDIVNFVDFVGNYDDEYFYLFVKSAEQFCTTDYCCRLPTDTATHEVSYKSAVRLCQRETCCKSLGDLPPIPPRFEYGRTEDTLKQEGKQIQFKFVTSHGESAGKSLAHKVSYYSTRYISAFANHEGGHIYFGIEDTTAGVYGEEMNSEDEAVITSTLERKIRSMIWGDVTFVPRRGMHWDIHFLPVYNSVSQFLERRTVIVISVCKVSGGVFTSCPESYIVTRKSEGGWQENTVHRLNFDQWKRLLLNQVRDIPSLHTRFVKLVLMTPQCRLTFALPQTLQAAREKVIKLSVGLNVHPRNFLHSLNNSNLKQAATQIISTFAEDEHLVFALDSWGLSHPISPSSKSENDLICMAVFSMKYGIHVVSLVHRGTEGRGGGEEEMGGIGEGGKASGGEGGRHIIGGGVDVEKRGGKEGREYNSWQYTSDLAVSLKQCLVNHGGCSNHLGIRIHLLDISSTVMMETFQSAIADQSYPQTYCIRQQAMDSILNALTIAIASYKPFGPYPGVDVDQHFLLTCDQLELLWSHQYTKELWVHGPPGAGKTVTAMEMVREFRRRGNGREEVLYVAENSLICSYVRSFDICLVVSRRELMNDAVSPDVLNSKYGQIKNVIVDEAQNFKSRDGDWYGLLEKMAKQKVGGPFDLTAGYFWLFMDYAQKVHKFEAGLPGLIGKNNFMLSEISRNSKEIFEYASKFMDKSSEETIRDNENSVRVSCGVDNGKALKVEPVLGHQFSSGQDVSVVKCDKACMQDVLFQVLKKFSQDGVELGDMAILVSKKKDGEEIKHSIQKTNLFGSIDTKTIPTNSISPELYGSNLSSGVDSSAKNSVAISTSTAPVLYSLQSNTNFGSNASQKSISTSKSGTNTTLDQNTSHNSADALSNSHEGPNPTTRLHGTITSGDNTASQSDGVLVSTVRDFSGLDKSVIVGMEPRANPNHAHLEKLILNLSTRARDSLVILTSSDDLMDMLKPSQ